MEEEVREQPLEELANASGEAVENGAESVNGSLNTAQDDLPEPEEKLDLGKFKSPQALLDAYNNLQAEFTKKCQRLSALEKDKIETGKQEPQQEDVDAAVSQFLSTHAEAHDFAEQLKEKVASSKATTLQAVDDAWSGMVLDQIRQNAASEKIVDKYILSSESARKTIIENYLNSLKNNAPPMTISTSGQRVVGQSPSTPTSLGEAKQLVEKMFS